MLLWLLTHLLLGAWFVGHPTTSGPALSHLSPGKSYCYLRLRFSPGHLLGNSAYELVLWLYPGSPWSLWTACTCEYGHHAKQGKPKALSIYNLHTSIFVLCKTERPCHVAIIYVSHRPQHPSQLRHEVLFASCMRAFIKTRLRTHPSQASRMADQQRTTARPSSSGSALGSVTERTYHGGFPLPSVKVPWCIGTVNWVEHWIAFT